MTTRPRLPELAVALPGPAGLLALAGTLWGARAVPVLTGSKAPGLPTGSLVLITPSTPIRYAPAPYWRSARLPPTTTAAASCTASR